MSSASSAVPLGSTGIEHERLKNAILQFTVNLIGVILIGVLYLNYVLLRPYIRPLFWAAAFSVPLHSLKEYFLQHIYESVDNGQVSALNVFVLGSKAAFQGLLGPIWIIGSNIINGYMTKVSAISKVSVATVELPPTSPGSPGAAVGNEDDNESVGAESLKSQTTDKDDDGSSALAGSIESLADSSAGLCDVESVETDSKANSTSSFSSQLERSSSVISTPNQVKSSIPTSSQFDFDSPTTYKSLQIQSVKKRRRHAALDSVENMNSTPSQRTPLSAVTFQNPSTPAPSTPYHDAKELSSPLSPNMTPVRKVILRDSIGNGTGPRSRLRNGMSSKLGKPRAFEFESAMKPKKGGKPNRLRKYSLSLIYAQSISQTFIQDLSATTSASNFYFKLLFRFFGIYVLHYIFASLSLRNYVVIGITAVTAMLCHLVYHLLLRMVKLYFGEVIGNVKSATEVLYENCKDLSIRYLRLGSGIAWMDKKYKMGKSEAKEALIRNADSFVATFLIIMVLSTGFLLGLFLLFKIIQEANALMEGTVSIIDETLSADIKSRLQTAITDSLGHGISWADKKLEEMYPNTNITLSFIYLKLSESYQQLTNQATPTYHDPSILVELNSTSAVGNTLSNLNGTKSVLLKTPSIAFASLPVTSQILNRLATGDLSILTDISTLYTALTELRNSSTHFVKAILSSSSATSQSTTTQNIFRTSTHYLSSMIQTLVTTSFSLTLTLFTLFIDFFGLVFQFVLFLFTLHYLLVQERNIVSYFSRLIVHVDTDGKLMNALEDNINAVFSCTGKMTVFHGLFTFLSFSVFGVELVYISTFITMFLSIIPVANPVVIAIPACISLYWQSKMWSAIILMLLHLFVSWNVDPSFYAEIPDINPYYSSLAVILGLWTFGIEGLLIGPVLMAVVPTIVSLLFEKI